MWFCYLGQLNRIYSKLRSCTDQSTGPFKFPEAEVLSIIKVEEIDTEINIPIILLYSRHLGQTKELFEKKTTKFIVVYATFIYLCSYILL